MFSTSMYICNTCIYIALKFFNFIVMYVLRFSVGIANLGTSTTITTSTQGSLLLKHERQKSECTHSCIPYNMSVNISIQCKS